MFSGRFEKLLLLNRILKHKFFIWLCGGIIVPLLMVPAILQLYVEPAAKNKLKHQQELIDLKILIRKLSYRDEETYRFCSESKNLIKDNKYYLELSNINQKRDQLLEDLANYTLKLFDEKQIHDISFNAIKSFSQWNNKLYFAHSAVCSLPHKSPMEMRQWRETIIKTINYYQ